MNDFKEYLREKHLLESTIKIYQSCMQSFIQWLNTQDKTPGQSTYNDLLNYISYCTSGGKNKRYINNKLAVLRHYFEYLKQEKKIRINPALSLTIRGVNKRIPHDLLSMEQLEEIYNKYQDTGMICKRNKVIAGLIIYQGLKLEELETLEAKDINLREGKIIIQESRRSYGRSLKLEAPQVIEIQEYLQKTRTLLIKTRGKASAKLLVSTGSGERLKNSINKMFIGLRKQYPGLKTPEQIRQSVISHWLKMQDIRQVQYMAGHKYVSSTERYQSNNLEDLHEQLKQYHPIK